MATKRKALAGSPLEEMTQRPATRPSAEKPRKSPRARATFHLPVDLIDGLRNAVVALSGPPHRLTLAAVAENALRRELERLQKDENRGKPFPQRSEDLSGGRPIGS